MGDYRATYRRSIEDPDGVLGRRGAGHPLADRAVDRPGRESRAVLPVVPRRRAEHLRERAGPARRRRARRPGRAGLRQPGHRHPAHLHLRGAARRGRDLRRGARLARRAARATGSSSTCRWCRRPSWRCWPAPGSGAVHSVVFGGFAANELAARVEDARAEGRGVRVLRHRGVAGGRVQAAARPGARAVVAPARARGGPAAPAGRGRDDRAARPRLAASWSPTPSPPSACRSRPPTRSTCSTRRARPPSPRASCATTAVTRSPCSGRCRTSTTSGRGDVWWTASDVGWVVGHSYIVYAPLLVGATTVLYEGKPVGTPDAGAFWRVVAQYGVQALFTAPTAIRAVKKEDPDGAAARGARRVVAAHPVPRRRAAGPGHLGVGDRAARRTGHRPLVADRDRLADRGQPARARADADQARVADRAGARLRRAGARPVRRRGRRRAPRARSASSCRCRPARCRRCGATTTGSSRRTCRRSTATT